MIILLTLEFINNTRNIVEGTRGPFYTIGRSSLVTADTLIRKQKKETNKNIFRSEFNSAVIAMLLKRQHTKVKELLGQVCDEVETVEEARPMTALFLPLLHLLLIFFLLLLPCLAL